MKAIKLQELSKRLTQYDNKFEIYHNRGKGSHRVIYHPNIAGKAESFPFKCHGKNPEIAKKQLKNIIRYFQLPKNIFD